MVNTIVILKVCLSSIFNDPFGKRKLLPRWVSLLFTLVHILNQKSKTHPPTNRVSYWVTPKLLFHIQIILLNIWNKIIVYFAFFCQRKWHNFPPYVSYKILQCIVKFNGLVTPFITIWPPACDHRKCKIYTTSKLSLTKKNYIRICKRHLSTNSKFKIKFKIWKFSTHITP